jgi:hypothetical protein
MRAWLFAAGLLAICLLASGGTAQAASGGNLPGGSWSQTCRNGAVNYNVLYAQCQRLNGSWWYSSIDPRSCGNRGVGNNDGNLVCEAGGGGNLPGGSWRQSCRNGNMNHNVLHAQCQRVNGNWRNSTIDPRSCGNRGVGNNDGNLVCEGSGGILPNGSWQQSCRNGNMNYNMLYAQCQRVNGSYRVSSIDPRSCGNRGVGNNDGNLVCEGGGGGNLPSGSWRQSCRNGNMYYSTLNAQCQRVNGSWRDSSIDTRSCGNRGVGNNDGNLVCEGGAGGGNLPGGSWRQSCRNGSMNYNTLSAQCQRVNGSWRNSSINTRSCGNRGVGNNDGNLVCE